MRQLCCTGLYQKKTCDLITSVQLRVENVILKIYEKRRLEFGEENEQMMKEMLRRDLNAKTVDPGFSEE